MSDAPRIPSPFQKFNAVRGGFSVTGDFPSVSAEQRRLLLEELLGKQFKESGWPEITLNGKVAYVPDYERGYQSSIVRIPLSVPPVVSPDGKTVLKLNVPASGDWSLIVLTRVLNYVGAWISKLPPKE